MPSPYSIDEDTVKRQAKPAKDSYSFEEMQERLQAIEAEQAAEPAAPTEPETVSFEDMQERIKNLEGQRFFERVSEYTAPIGKALSFPQRATEGLIRGAGAALSGDLEGAREYATLQRPPMDREWFAKQGVPAEENIPTPFRDITGRTVKTSPAGLAATGWQIATDPLNYINPVKAGGAVAKIPGKVWGGVTKKAASTLANIAESDWDYLIKNRERLKGKGYTGQEGLSEMAATVDVELDKIKDRAAFYREKAKVAVDDAKAEWNELKRDLKEPTKNLEEQNRIIGQMQQVKEDLIRMSGEADKALAESGKMYRRGDIIDLLKSVAKQGLDKDIVTPAAQKTVDTIADIVERLGGSVQQPAGFARKQQAKIADEMLDAPRVRDILKQVRDTIDFSKTSGEFDDSLNRVLKQFQYGISQVLKNDVPEYLSLMDSMSEMSDVLGDMRSYVGGANATQEQIKATAMMDALRKGGAKSDALRELLTRFANITQNDELLARLEELKDRSELREVMEPMTFKRDFSTIFKKRGKSLDELTTTADELTKQEKRLTKPHATAALLKALSGQNLNVDEALKQAARIKKETGIDVLQQARDMGTVNRITSAKPAGAKWVAGGGAVGTALGALGSKGDPLASTIAAGIGGIAGAAHERYAGRGAKWLVDRGTGVRQIASRMAAPVLTNRMVQGIIASKPYAFMQKYLAPNSLRTFQIYHNVLYNNDPEYRNMVDGLEAEQQ